MIHQWKKALLESAADIFERGAQETAEVDEETVRSLHVPPTGSGLLANHER